MNENSSQNNRGPRNHQRGGRRNGGPRGNNASRPPRERSNYGTRTAPPKPLTLWQKIAGFFTGKSKPATAAKVNAPVAQRDTQRESKPSDGYRRAEQRPDRDAREPRKIETVEVTSSKLYVGNLSFDAAENDLSDLFNGVGKVRSAEVVSNPYTQKSKGFAFITMETIDEAKRAVLELHDKEFMGRKLLVSGARTSERNAA